MKIHIENKLYTCGDIHGNGDALSWKVQYHNLKDCTLILLGDVGIFRYRDYKHYKFLDETCRQLNITIYALRGNHDNPGFFNDRQNPIISRFWSKFTNIKPLSDFDVLVYQNKHILILPGAISRDRCTRKSWRSTHINVYDYYRGGDWWAKETIHPLIDVDVPIDAIMSHNGPRIDFDGNRVPDTFKEQDPHVESDLKEEQTKLYEALDKYKPSTWWFGHYHISFIYKLNNTMCRIMDIEEIDEFKFELCEE